MWDQFIITFKLRIVYIHLKITQFIFQEHRYIQKNVLSFTLNFLILPISTNFTKITSANITMSNIGNTDKIR